MYPAEKVRCVTCLRICILRFDYMHSPSLNQRKRIICLIVGIQRITLHNAPIAEHV